MRIDLPNDREMEFPMMSLVWVGVALLVLSGLFTTFYQVNSDEHGVVLRLGRYQDTAEPGLHTKLPFGIDRVYKVPTGVSSIEEFGYRSGQRGDFSDENLMLTGDLNIVRAGWSVQFRRHDPLDYLFNVDDPVDTLRDIAQSVMREVMGDRASIPVLTVGRAEIQHRARELIQQYCDQFKMGVRIDVVNLQFVSPPQEVVSAFDDLNKSEHDAARFFEEAAQQYQERVPMARGQAQRLILEAEGFAQRRINIARGEAQRFRSMTEAYQLSPDVTRNRMYLETMEDVLPRLRGVTVIDESVQGLLPHMSLREGGQP
jgi:modulator of FtsH protease HflK